MWTCSELVRDFEIESGQARNFNWLVGPNRGAPRAKVYQVGGVNLPKRAPAAARSDDESCGMTVGSVGYVYAAKLIGRPLRMHGMDRSM